MNNAPPISVVRYEPPEPAAAGPAAGWCGAIAGIFCVPVVYELWKYIDTTDGSITYDGEINIDGHGDTGSLVKLDDPTAWRALAAVSAVLADAVCDPDTLDEPGGDPIPRCG